MLVQKKTSADSTVIGPKSKTKKAFALARPDLDSLPVKVYKKKTKTLFSPAWLPFSDIPAYINSLKPDIVHLHWIAGGMIRVESLSRIKAPLVWSLHDMWAFTGGCHNDEACGKFKSRCGQCPVLGSNRFKDLSYRLFARKQKAYAKINNLTIIGLSRWLAQSAEQSTLFRDKTVVNLPNPIDRSIFRPLEKTTAKEILGIPKEKKMLLYGAMNATFDPLKGFTQLINSLRILNVADVEITVFGSYKPEEAPDFKFPSRYLGSFQDDLSLIMLYNAADVVVVPSLQENLSNVIMESMACGTPVVCFDVGGNSDMVDHKISGYLAQPFDSVDLSNGIKWVLDNNDSGLLSKNAVKKVEDSFEMTAVSAKYIELYRKILNRQDDTNDY